MLKISEKFYVGFNKRTNEESKEKFLLAYIVKDKTLRSFDSWRDHHIAIKEIDNQPKSGFKIFGDTKRSRDWFGSGRSMLYIEHPEGFVFEISVNNLTKILDHCDIVKNEFTEKMILAHEGSKLILIPTNSDLYQEAIADTKRMLETKTKSLVKPSSLKIGDIVEFPNKSKVLYLGKYKAFTLLHNVGQNRETTYTTSKQTKERHFYLEGADTKYPLLRSVQTIKIYRVTSHENISQEKALEIICKNYHYYDSYIPILPDSIFHVENRIWKSHEKCLGYWITFDSTITGQNITFKSISKFDTPFNKQHNTEIIWITLGKNKLYININADQLSRLE